MAVTLNVPHATGHSGAIPDMEALFLETEGRKAGKKWFDKQWHGSRDGAPPIKQVLILQQAARVMASPAQAFKSNRELARALAEMNDPRTAEMPARNRTGRHRSNGRVRGDEEMFYRILTHGLHANHADYTIVRDLLIGLLTDKFNEAGRQGEPIISVIGALDSPSSCLARLLGSLAPSDESRDEADLKSIVADGLQRSPNLVGETRLKRTAADAIEHFRASPRIVHFGGPEQSGQLEAVQYAVEYLGKRQRLQIDSGETLAVLALNLEDLTPPQFVNQVCEFYQGRALSPMESGIMMLDSKLTAIRKLAAQIPAFVILVGIPHVNEVEIVRSVQQDIVGEVLAAIFRGHRNTRLLVTTVSEKEGLPPLLLEAKRFAIKVDSEWLEPFITICFDAFADRGKIERDACRIRTPIRVRRSTPMLADVVGRQIGATKTDLRARLEDLRCRNILLYKDDQEGLVRYIWNLLPAARDRLLLGLISASHDGLRYCVIKRMVSALMEIGEPFESSLEQQIVALERALRGLLLVRKAPREAGAAATPPTLDEDLYFIDRKWRHFTLEAFFAEPDRRLWRFVHWLIAREAAEQSTSIRRKGGSIASEDADGLARDVQALRSLIASIDASEARIEPSGRFPESQILPPLDFKAAPPNGVACLRYAFLQLFKVDIEGGDFATLNVWDDAGLRLALLLPLFYPGQPHHAPHTLVLNGDWRAYTHLQRAFSGHELCDLLTAMALAAQRAQRFDIVSSAARLAEHLLDEGSNGRRIAASDVLRVLRAEVDVGLLIGGNPDSVLLRIHAGTSCSRPTQLTLQLKPSLSLQGTPRFQVRIGDVIDRLEALLSGYYSLQSEEPSCAHLKARGKLLARLGEAHHLAGDYGSAERAFKQAEGIERKLVEGLRSSGGCAAVPSSLSPVLGGRGARAFLRFLLDKGRRRQEADKGRKHSDGADLIRVNGLHLPPLIKLDSQLPEFMMAKELDGIGRRRLRQRRTADRVGALIDSALMAASQHEFVKAFRYIDEAGKFPFSSGSSIEVLLDLAAVQSRLLIDCLRWLAQTDNLGETEVTPKLADLTMYLGAPGCNRSDLVNWLLSRAEDCQRAFSGIVNSYPPEFPYRTFGNLMAAWLCALRSVFPTHPKFAREMQLRALAHIDTAIREMLESGYRMNLSDACRLRACLRKALRKYLQAVSRT